MRSHLLVAYATEDDTFGDEDDLLAYLCAVDGLVMLAFGRLLLWRSLPRELMYGGGTAPSLDTLEPGICRELFRFENH